MVKGGCVTMGNDRQITIMVKGIQVKYTLENSEKA